MKRKLFTGLVIGLLGIALVSVASQAKASDYIGDFCWQLVQTNGDSTSTFSIVNQGVESIKDFVKYLPRCFYKRTWINHLTEKHRRKFKN